MMDIDIDGALLDAIRFHWDDVYEISFKWGQPRATHRDDLTVITADSLVQLERRIDSDFASRIRHESQSALETAEDFLSRSSEDQVILNELCGLFPTWAIWYSAEFKCYMARPKGSTICGGKSLELIRIALTRIEQAWKNT